MSKPTLLIERPAPHIALVRLNRPERLNALSRAFMQDIIDCAESFRDDTGTRAVVFTGNGPHFSAGADLKERAASAPTTLLEARRSVLLGRQLVRALAEMHQITIAAIHGVALGGGACIATACDFRIASPDARCGYPEVQRGMNLNWIGLPACVHLVGPARAKRMIALGNPEPAPLLHDWGWLDEVVPQPDLIDTALAMAADYAARPPVAVQMIKQSVNAVAAALDNAVMHMDYDQWILTTRSNDYAEGIRAFLDKREPRFTGD